MNDIGTREGGVQFINNDRDAELNAARQMRRLGYADAAATRPGRDGGIDVRATTAVAQVKCRAHPTGTEAVQRLYGARGEDHALDMLFFSSSSYSKPAVGCANELGIHLFTYDHRGAITPINESARQLVARRTAKDQPRSKRPGATPSRASAATRPDIAPPSSPSEVPSPGRTDISRVSWPQSGVGAASRVPERTPVRPAPSILRALGVDLDEIHETVPETNTGNAGAARAERKKARARAEQRRRAIDSGRAVQPTVFERLDSKDSQLRESSASRRESRAATKDRKKSPFRRFLGQ